VRRTATSIARQGCAGRLELRRHRQEARGLFSPLKIIECVQAAVELPFDEGLARSVPCSWNASTARSAPA
jgi:hypothetical protein